MRKLPSPWAVIWNDNPSFLMTLIGPVFFVYAAFVSASGVVPGGRTGHARPVDPQFAEFALACTASVMIALWSIVVLRLVRIRALFETGAEVVATVQKVSRSKGWKRMRLAFEHAGTTYSTRSTVRQCARTRGFVAGSAVSLLVDPANPRRGVVIGAFVTTEPRPARSGVGHP